MKLIQIPFSHNCIKVRVALERKGIPYEIENINPTDRSGVIRLSGQGLVPVLVDGERTVADSTAILLHLEEKFPEPPLIPRPARERAECLVLEDWADRAFMAVSRRIAYFNVLNTPGRISSMFFPKATGLKKSILEVIARRKVAARFQISAEKYPRDVAEVRAAAALAVARLGAGPYLLGGAFSVAHIALATMSAPLAADAGLWKDEAVAALLAWGAPIVGPEVAARFRGDNGSDARISAL